MRRLFTLLLLIVFLYNCSGVEKQQFEYAGGTLTMALSNEPSTYIPRQVYDVYSATVISQITECLVDIDPKTLKIVPKIAEKWSSKNDGKIYEFTLREGVRFHPHDVFNSDDDRLLTTKDVQKTFEMGCGKESDGSDTPLYSHVLKDLVQGANDFHEGKSKTISGIVCDGNSVRFELTHSDHNFLYKLANISASIVSHRIIEKNLETDIIGTGPFRYAKHTNSSQPSLILVKNNDYYLNDKEGNALPYLDSLVFLFQSRKLEQLDLFESGKTDLIVGLPTSRIARMLDDRIEDFNSAPPKLILAENPLLETNFYFFNMLDPRFKNPKVRQAFNYAVNREVLGQNILRNQYYDLGHYGITPPIQKALKGYNFAEVKEASYKYDPEKARELLAEAGYPDGKGFGVVELRYNINEIHLEIADEFSKQIKRVLGITVNIEGSEFNMLKEDYKIGNGDIFRSGWNADYPSPESFLMSFYGANVPDDSLIPSPINMSRYTNKQFDTYFEQALKAEKMTDQMRLLSKAEVELMKDPPIIPLWYTGDIEIAYSYVRNFHFNALNYFNFTKVYIKPWTTEEYEKYVSSQK